MHGSIPDILAVIQNLSIFGLRLSLAELSSVFIIKHGKINGCCSGLIILKCISFCQEEYWRRNIYFHLICRWSEPSISNSFFYPNISVHYRHNLKCFVFVSFTYKNILSSLTIYYCSTNFVKKWMPPLWDLAKSGHSSGDLEIQVRWVPQSRPIIISECSLRCNIHVLSEGGRHSIQKRVQMIRWKPQNLTSSCNNIS